MNRARCRSLALAALLCGGGPVAADTGSSGRPPEPALVREQVAGTALQPGGRAETDPERAFAGETLTWGYNRFTAPPQPETWSLDSPRSLPLTVLAIEWQHSMNASNYLTLSARHGDSLYGDVELPGPSTGSGQASSATAAALSWSTLFGGESRVIGRLYAGDQDMKERSNDRHYYGLQVEGRYGLWRDHAPFASLNWQRNNYESQDNTGPNGSLLRRESFSRFAAGWNWQVGPGLDVRAEANYRLADDGADATESDRTQLHFSTRYGFR